MRSRGDVKIWNLKLRRHEGMAKTAEELLIDGYVVNIINTCVYAL